MAALRGYVASLLENLRSLTDKTVVLVTHRKAALSICDRVLRFTESGIEDVTGALAQGRAEREVVACGSSSSHTTAC